MVYSPLQAAAKYFRYYVHAANSKGHGMHSPFVFEFITKVMNDFATYDDYARVETLRKSLLKDQAALTISAAEAMFLHPGADIATIAGIARTVIKPKKFGQLLYRMVRFYQPATILELGTSLGLTTQYLALGNPAAKVITLENTPAIADVAQDNFDKSGIGNVALVSGHFEKTLPVVLRDNPKIDLVIIDGFRLQGQTELYFQQLLPYIHNDTLLICYDVHGSKEMERAWKHIVEHEAVTCDIDLFHLGIVCFRKEFKEKQRFSVRV